MIKINSWVSKMKTGPVLSFMGLGIFLLALCPTMTLAQVSAKGGPVMIGSDTYSMDQKALTQTFVGRVQIQQTDSRLQADQITITHLKSAGGNGMGEVSLIEARGNVYYVTPQESIRGDMAVYTASSDTMVITGEVILSQGQNVMEGNRLTVEVKAEKTTMDANASTRTRGRVRGVFYPKDEKR
jgi:lipopolysaccharide export system protein LptA